jgi:signal transduction histidine kinase
MTDPGLPDSVAVTQDGIWDTVVPRMGGTAVAITGFAIAYTLLIYLGYEFKEDVRELTILWPAAGLLMSALWIGSVRLWPVFIAIQFGVELIFAWQRLHPFAASMPLFMLANSLDAIVGATIARALISRSTGIHIRQTLYFLFATACGAAASATLGALVSVNTYSSLSYLHEFQLWWAGNWLGTLTIAPVVFTWAVPLRSLYPTLRLRSRLELSLYAVVLAGLAVWIFASPAGGMGSILQMPVVLAAAMVAASFRLPPRWAATLAAMSILIAAEMASRGTGPFAVTDPFLRTAQLQLFLAEMAVVTFMLVIVLGEMRIANARLAESEGRYRSFVELSTEAVWRVEIDPPMPVSLALAEQVEWLHANATVAESSLTYGEFDPPENADSQRPWRREIPWSAVYEQHLAQVALHNYSTDGLRFTANLRGRVHTFLTSFSGIVQNGFLQRIWGVARDVTELVELNSRLVREQDRLKSYARQIVTAEEKARRATAVDLHDGIGQVLVGMSMTLEVARDQAPSHVHPLIDEIRFRLRDVQERTRHMISDLSPPGLYDLGLVPALQWLAVYVRGHDKLHVTLDCQVREEAVPVEMRLLTFKLVRELLRNVVKHAGVNAAHVQVRGDREQLLVQVRDDGRGFEWQMDMFGARSGGFGLWSIADRVNEAGGRFNVETAPGRGARFEMEFPLRSALQLTG